MLAVMFSPQLFSLLAASEDGILIVPNRWELAYQSIDQEHDQTLSVALQNDTHVEAEIIGHQVTCSCIVVKGAEGKLQSSSNKTIEISINSEAARHIRSPQRFDIWVEYSSKTVTESIRIFTRNSSNSLQDA